MRKDAAAVLGSKERLWALEAALLATGSSYGANSVNPIVRSFGSGPRDAAAPFFIPPLDAWSGIVLSGSGDGWS